MKSINTVLLIKFIDNSIYDKSEGEANLHCMHIVALEGGIAVQAGKPELNIL